MPPLLERVGPAEGASRLIDLDRREPFSEPLDDEAPDNPPVDRSRSGSEAARTVGSSGDGGQADGAAPSSPSCLPRVRDRDERAFADLWRRYQPLVLRYARVLIGDGADDVASETWIAVVRSLDRFTGDETELPHLADDHLSGTGPWTGDASAAGSASIPQEQISSMRRARPSPDPATLVVDAITGDGSGHA